MYSSPTIACFGLLLVVLWVKNQQNLRIDKGFVSAFKLVHFAKFVNAFEKSDVFLILDNIETNPEHEFNKAMSTEALIDDQPDAGLAWITLLLSSGLLGALFVWSLQNPSVLLPSLSTEQSKAQYDYKNIEENSVNVNDNAGTSGAIGSPDINAASLPDGEQVGEKTLEKSPIVENEAVVFSEVVNLAEAEASGDTPLEKLKRQELATLPGLAGRVRYNPGESEHVEGSDKLLNRMFELLFLYIDSEVVVKISSGDFEDDAQNLELSETRAQKLVAYLVGRGLDEQRFEIVPMGRAELPLGGHRVNVYAKNI